MDTFLFEHKTPHGVAPTHTSMRGGSYYIPDDDLLEFYTLYAQAIKDNVPLFLTERVTNPMYFFTDVDFEKPEDVPDSFIDTLVPFYKTAIANVLGEQYNQKHLISTRDVHKIHLHFPGLVVTKDQALSIRDVVVAQVQLAFPGIAHWDKIIDKSVYSSGLRLLGSKKRIADTSEHQVYSIKGREITPDLLQLVSIRCKQQVVAQTILKPVTELVQPDDPLVAKACEIASASFDFLGECDVVSTKTVQARFGPMLCINLGNRHCPFVDREHKRESNYLFLRLDKRGLVLKCHDDDCKDKYYPERPLSFLELRDYFGVSPYDVTDFDLKRAFSASFHSGTQFDIAQFAFLLYKNRFRVTKTKQWYEFRGHRVVPAEGLRVLLSTEVVLYYEHYLCVLKERLSQDQENQQGQAEIARLSKIINSLKTTVYKTNILQELYDLFIAHEPDFAEKMNERKDILVFNNGVYDCARMCFRDGEPSDLATYSTLCDYIALDENSEDIKTLKRIFGEVFGKHFDYIMTTIARCIDGFPDEKFHIWTGSGSNGKSMTVSFIEQCFGDYAAKLPASFLVNKRGMSGSASPEVMRIKGRRFVTMQELDDDSTINAGILKEISGGDRISGRPLYGEQQEFYLQAKYFLCCNSMPNIKAMDGGTWRRIRSTEFTAKFVDGTPQKENEFKKDMRLSETLKNLKPAMMSFLVYYYQAFRKDGMVEPESVLAFTRDYQKTSNVYLQFIDACVRLDDQSTTDLPALYAAFCAYYVEEGSKGVAPKRSDFKVQMDRLIGKAPYKVFVSTGSV